MAIKRAKTIVEYAIRKWLIEQDFAIEYFTLAMDGNVGTLKNQRGDTLILAYDPTSKSVHIKEETGDA